MKKCFLIMILGILLSCSNNKILEVKEDTPIPTKIKKGDSYIFLDYLEHQITPEYITYDLESRELKILFRGYKGDIEKVNIIINGKKYEMKSIGYYGVFEYFQLKLVREVGEEVRYYFELIDDKFKYNYGENSSYYSDKVGKFTYTIKKTDKRELSWNEGIVWYSIFVDRFRDGNKDNSPIYSEYGPKYHMKPIKKLSDGTFVSELIDSETWGINGNLQGFEIRDWGSDWNSNSYIELESEEKYFENAVKNSRRYGGDLQGIEEKLDYLEELGVGGVSLSPVFYSNSGSKLDTIDYRHISPDYGVTSLNSYKELEYNLSVNNWTKSDLLFQKVVDEIHKRNMKIVLEVNFEYVSTKFLPYRDLLENKEKSKYKNWFILEKSKDGSINYDILKEYGIVALNLEDISLQDYLIDATAKWVRGNEGIGIDGYYVKNNMTSETFLKRWKKSLLEIRKDFLVVGETTEVNKRYQGVEGFDIFTSYELGELLNRLFNNPKKSLGVDIKEEIRYQLQTTPKWDLIESYDTDRFYSSLVNPNREYDRLNDFPKDDYINMNPSLVDLNAVKKLKLAVLIQQTLSSNPVIYYGSEKGVWGGDSPDNRKPMIWDDIQYEKETDQLKNYSGNKEKIKRIFEGNDAGETIAYEVKRREGTQIENFYKETLKFKKDTKELTINGGSDILNFKDGKYQVDPIEDGIISYEKYYKNKNAIILINTTSREKKIDIPIEREKDYKDIYTEEVYSSRARKLRVSLGPFEYKILYTE